MDSEGSQDASSGNDSDSESYSRSRNQEFTRKRSSSNEENASPKSRSRSRSLSSSSESERSSDNDNSNPQSPADSDVHSRPKTPPSPSAEPEALSPNMVNNDSVSVSSSRSNSPEPNIIENNHNASSSNNFEHDDNHSVKSDSSQSKQSDKDSDSSDESIASHTSRDGRKIANLDDGNTSDSSMSSDDSRDQAKSQTVSQPEEGSDGDTEMSDHEKHKEEVGDTTKIKEAPINVNIVHEDLSDVSDLEDSMDQSDYETPTKEDNETGEIEDHAETKPKKVIERTNRSEDGEEQLDFEAEDGECAEPEISKDKDYKDGMVEHEPGELRNEAKKPEKNEELEEGELSDEDEVRPEETEPRPVCRFFSRGQCTWGASCRFLHPGVTDKGNYTMFELVRPVVPGDFGERIMYSGRADPPPIESAWERGLRTAKEMMRKSIKRKEQDIDFEEKKMNLSLAQEEFDKENGYYAKASSPEPSRYVTIRHPPIDYPPVRATPDDYYARRQVIYEPDYTTVPRERVRTYREVQPHRSTDYYTSKHEEESTSLHSKSKRPKREVIVQRAEERSRGDEWSDPWMRLKSPAGRKGSRRRSYSSGSSYSSSSSSASTKSSYRSRSRSSHHKRSPRTHRKQVSPSVIVSERKAANERAALMNPPAPRKKPLSPGMMRLGAQNPPAPSKVDQFGRTRSKLAVAAALARVKGRTRSSRSSSGSSSGSSSSDSDSSASSSSSSRNASVSPKHSSGVDLAIALKAKAIDALKTGSEKRQIKLNLKTAVGAKKPEFSESSRKTDTLPSRKRLASSPPATDSKNSNKKASSRREELLKQLKAVEDAIAKKRSKAT